ncbi:helicase IV, partial [Vibrio parahaemolyticus]|nr:helicase IV [Vibrio parahaemolyticus]
MQLTATSKAQFFIQNEYHHVEIKENSVLLS